MLFSVIFIVVSVWLSLSLLIYVFQPNFIYYPHPDVLATPATVGLQYDDINLTTSDGVKLNGWWIPASSSHEDTYTLLFFHGNAGNISHRLDSIQLFHKLGLSVFIIDYRGYGNSEGNISESGTYQDALAAWQYLTEEQSIPANRIIIFGRSLGGAVASWLATQTSPAAIILESTFTSIADIGKHYYPYLPTQLLARIRYPSIERVIQFNSPTLFIHSKSDDIIPFKHGQQLFEAAKQPKFFLEIIGDHNTGFATSGPRYTDGIETFIKQINSP